MEEATTTSFEEAFIQAAAACSPVRFGKDEILEAILFDMPVEEAFCIDAGGIQASCSVINVKKARALAGYLVDDKGDLQLSKARLARDLLERRRHSIGFGAEEARGRDHRVASCADSSVRECRSPTNCQKNEPASCQPDRRNSHQATRFFCLIRRLSRTSHVRRAVVAALCTTLRQSLGSCFATAPAIMVHDEQPLLFLRDLEELIETAQLKRTVAGNEYSVPMSSTWGQGDVKKPSA